MEDFWTSSCYLFNKTWIFVSIDIVNVGLDLKYIRLKCMLETITYNKVDHVGSIFLNGCNNKIYLFFHKKA